MWLCHDRRIPSPPIALSHDPKPSRSTAALTFFEIVPHLVELDHHGPAFRLGLLRIGSGELLEPGLDGGCRNAEELGRAVHGEAADIKQDGGRFHGQRLAAGGCVREVQAAAFAQEALLTAHPPVLDVLLAAAALAM